MLHSIHNTKQASTVIIVGGLLAALAAVSAKAAEKTLYEFKGGSDGALPYGALVADRSGNLFGTTNTGGDGPCQFGSTSGCGTVFEIAQDGSESVLYAFGAGKDGAYPGGGPIINSGKLYGTTGKGGGSANCAGGCGTVFKLTTGGTEKVLHAFRGRGDGIGPVGSLIADGAGNLYGVTTGGGNYAGSECAAGGCGTVFKLSEDKNESVLYAFQGGSDGYAPRAGLIADPAGDLYGTTIEGGGGNGCGGSLGCGTVFKIAPSGTENVVYAFQGGSDGALPTGVLIADSAGNLYGTTSAGGGCSSGVNGCGTVFKITPQGSESVLYAFQGGKSGWDPSAGLTMDESGDLYGTTSFGGSSRCQGGGCGTVFELAPGGTEVVLYQFTQAHGENSTAQLLLDKRSTLYGTTVAGGKYGDGVVFKVKD